MPPKNNTNPELDPVIADPVNRVCADCDAKAPRWASVNLGILVCIDCSGAHRNLGTHISVVKSVTLDKWLPKWITTVSKIGNESANGYYETRLDISEKPRESDSLEKKAAFIRKKYELKQYAPKNKPSPSELLGQGRDPHVYRDGGRGGRDRSDSGEDRRRGDDRRPPGRRRTPSPEDRPRRGGPPERGGAGRPAEPPPPAARVPAPGPAPAAKAPAKDSVDLLGGLDEAAPAATTPAAAAGQNWAQFGQQVPQQPAAPAPAPVATAPAGGQDLSSLNFCNYQPEQAQPQQLQQAQLQQALLQQQLLLQQQQQHQQGSGLPDVFKEPPAQHGQQMQTQLQDQKIDYMKNALASLYKPEPPENRFAAFGPAAGNGLGGMMASPGVSYTGGMANYNGYHTGVAAGLANQVMQQATQPYQGMNFMGTGLHGMQQHPAAPGGCGLGGFIGMQQTQPSLTSMGGVATGMSSMPSGFPGMCSATMPSQSAEASHAEAMSKVLNSLSLGSSLGGSAPKSPTGKQADLLQATPKGDSLTEIDAFSACGMAAPNGQSQSQPAAATPQPAAPAAPSRPMGVPMGVPMGGAAMGLPQQALHPQALHPQQQEYMCHGHFAPQPLLHQQPWPMMQMGMGLPAMGALGMQMPGR